MSRAGLLVPGASLQQAQNRARGRGFWLPKLLSDNINEAASIRPTTSFAWGGSAHVLGSWVEIDAALDEAVGFVRIVPASITGQAGGARSILFNLGVGAAGSEVTVIDNIGSGWWTSANALYLHPGWMFPLSIPRGSRVAGRMQSLISSPVVYRIELYGTVEGLRPSAKIASLGADTANSRGTVLTAPGAINTESAWTEITAATTEPYTALGVSIQGGGDAIQADAEMLVDVGVGASGGESSIISNLFVETTNTEFVLPVSTLVHPASIPKGSRLAARYQASGLGGSLDVILHGIRAAA